MSPRTVFLARLFGLYFILIAISMFLYKPAFVIAVAALLQNVPGMIVLGIFTVLGGLALVLVHNIWKGAAAVIVTLIGWSVLVKGLAFLWVPPGMESALYLDLLHYERFYYLYSVFALVLGAYLTYAGFAAATRASR